MLRDFLLKALKCFEKGEFCTFWLRRLRHGFRFLIEDAMIERPWAKNLRAVFDHSFSFLFVAGRFKKVLASKKLLIQLLRLASDVAAPKAFGVKSEVRIEPALKPACVGF